jgi:uncharacterized protein YggT (Ycf19 family)
VDHHREGGAVVGQSRSGKPDRPLPVPVTEPVLRPIRHRLPTFAMGLDLSPLVVLLAIYLLRDFVVPVLYRIAAEIG